MIALIQAGGAGTRLKSITGDLPKPMVPINGKPILEWQVLSLASSGVKDIVMTISKTGHAVPDYFGDGSKWGVNIRYIVEEEPLGSGGALYLASKLFDDDFFLVFGDLMLDLDWERFASFGKAKGASLVALVHPNSHPFDSDIIITDENDKIVALDSKHNVRNYYYQNLTNAGLYWCGKEMLHIIKQIGKYDFEKDIVLPLIPTGKVYAYRSSEYIKDCGTPDRYYSVGEDSRNGIIAAKNLKNNQKAIFLDRDGTINVFGDFVRKAEMLSLYEDSAEAIKMINESEYLAICITNQPVVARGETTFEELKRINNKLEDLLGEKGAYLNDLFFCPHHPDKGYEGEVPELKIECDCRKPKIGMLLKAREKYNIDLSESWFIGDTKQDVQTGINAGCKTIHLTCGDTRPMKKYEGAKEDYECPSLLEAVKLILSKK